MATRPFDTGRQDRAVGGVWQCWHACRILPTIR